MQCTPSQKTATIHNSSIRSDEGLRSKLSKSFAVVIRPLSTPLIKLSVHVSLRQRRSISVSLETKILFLNQTDFVLILTVALERVPNRGQCAGIYFDAIFFPRMNLSRMPVPVQTWAYEKGQRQQMTSYIKCWRWIQAGFCGICEITTTVFTHSDITCWLVAGISQSSTEWSSCSVRPRHLLNPFPVLPRAWVNT